MKEYQKIALTILSVGALGAYKLYKDNNTLNIQVVRYIFNNHNTIGRMYLNNVLFCDTLEDKDIDWQIEKKVYGSTAIPVGKYKTVVDYSPKFKKDLPHLLNVPHFEGIRIHTGSSEADTEGCILVGDYSNGLFKANKEYVEKIINVIKGYTWCYTEIVNM